MLFHAFLLLAHGEKAFAPVARPMMPHAVADATSPATPATVPRLPMQHVAQQIQPTSDSRSSTILMASNVLFYSGLSLLAGGAGLAMRRSGSTPSTTQTELTQALHVDPELGTATRTTAPVMMADDAEVMDRRAAVQKAAMAMGGAAAALSGAQAAQAKSVLGVNGALDFGPLAGDQPGGEGTGKALGINDDSLGFVLLGVTGSIGFAFSQWQGYQDDDEDFFDSYDSRRDDKDNTNRNRV
jgi:hypothetical protein